MFCEKFFNSWTIFWATEKTASDGEFQDISWILKFSIQFASNLSIYSGISRKLTNSLYIAN